ncbi:hypothetical protein [Stenotrophomonas sp. Iso1]|uniref:DUF6911 family protein n=1 Tax=Stenotrophomonas sp. Iso1 TaxID=2977283 RepID=UPI0022B7B714|nr:hypothetical protein [Stenotrophomonas sp. Iso1]
MSGSKRDAIVLEMRSLDKTMDPPARFLSQPDWSCVLMAIRDVFEKDGFVYLKVLAPRESFVKEISMKAVDGRYRVVALTRSGDPKMAVLEWRQESDFALMKQVRFGGDEWDARTICSDISVAERIFKEVYDFGGIMEGLSCMKSQWDLS